MIQADQLTRVLERLPGAEVGVGRGFLSVPGPQLEDLEARLPKFLVYSVPAAWHNLFLEGVSLVALPGHHAWQPFAGIFRDDPLYEDWQQAIRENRQADEDVEDS